MTLRALIAISVCTGLCIFATARAAVFDVGDAEENSTVGVLNHDMPAGMTTHVAVPRGVKFDSQGNLVVAGMVGSQNQEPLSTTGNSTGSDNDHGVIRPVISGGGGGGGGESVPEPSSLVLLGVATAGFSWCRWRRVRSSEA